VAKTLGGVTLPDSTEWTDRYAAGLVDQAVDVTLGGNPVVHSAARQLAQAITLEARDRVTWLTTAEVQSIQALAQVPGAGYTLDWDGDTHTVVFDHSAGALRFEPVLPHADQWTGTIRLLTI